MRRTEMAMEQLELLAFDTPWRTRVSTRQVQVSNRDKNCSDSRFKQSRQSEQTQKGRNGE
jgi:hypothetical protein